MALGFANFTTMGYVKGQSLLDMEKKLSIQKWTRRKLYNYEYKLEPFSGVETTYICIEPPNYLPTSIY